MIILSVYYGHLLRILQGCNAQTVSQALRQLELTAAQGHIMGFLAHRAEPPCPRDIEEFFQLSHPTVSGLLSRLEKKGFLALRPDEQDRRCKRIYVLPKGRQCNETMERAIRANEEQMVRDFTEEEKQLFCDFLCRAIANMGGSPCKSIHKEEPIE